MTFSRRKYALAAVFLALALSTHRTPVSTAATVLGEIPTSARPLSLGAAASGLAAPYGAILPGLSVPLGAAVSNFVAPTAAPASVPQIQPAAAAIAAAPAAPASGEATPTAAASLDRLSAGADRFKNTGEFDAAAAVWDQALLKDYEADPGDRFMPDSLPLVGARRQEANRQHLYRAGRPVLGAMARFAAEASRAESPVHGRTFSELLESLVDAVTKRYMVTVYAQTAGKKVLGRGVDDMRREIEKSGIADVSVARIEDFVRDYHSSVDGFRAQYGAEHFSDEAVRKAGFNAFAMHMFLSLTGQAPARAQAMYALALLHPITDDALDSGQDVGRAMRKISAALEGKAQTPESPYERIVLDFIGTVLKEFPSDRHPVVQRSLQLLQKEQLKSVALQKSDVSRSELALNTLRKGALTSLLFGYVAVGDLSNDQARFFYEAGFVLQLIDDLLDVKQDIESGSATLWTKAWSKPARAREELQRLFAVQKGLEGRSRVLLADMPNGGRFAAAFDYGFKMFMTSALLDPFKLKPLAPVLEDRLAMRAPHLKTAVFTLVDRLRADPKTDMRLLEILDDGFLGGAYRQAREGKPIKTPRRFAIAGWSPAWWGIATASFLQGWLNTVINKDKSEYAQIVSASTMVGFFALYVLSLIGNLTALGLKSVIPLVFLGSFLFFTSKKMNAWAVPGILLGLLALWIARLLIAA